MAPRTIQVQTANNDFQHIEVLSRNRKKRHQNGRFFVEGVKAINRAVGNGWQIDALVYSSDGRLSDWAREILRTANASTHYELAPNLMEQLSDKEDTSEVIALVAIPDDGFDRIAIDENFLAVILDRPSSPGNIGTIIRSCDSFKASGLVITGHSADLYDPQTIRASVGSIFTIPSIRMPSYKELVPWLDTVREVYPDFQIVGSSAKADLDIVDADFTRPTAFILGNETDGLSTNFRDLCDSIVKIPIYGSASSLNIACAASISLYEIDRQRRTKS